MVSGSSRVSGSVQLLLFSLIPLLFTGVPVRAQTSHPPEVFVEAPEAEGRLDPGQRRAFDKVIRRPTTADARLVRLAELNRLASGQPASITLAPGLQLALDGSRVERRGPGDFTWFGSSSTSA